MIKTTKVEEIGKKKEEKKPMNKTELIEVVAQEANTGPLPQAACRPGK